MNRHIAQRPIRAAGKAAWPLALAFLACGCGEPGDGLEKYPVRGQVLVNGQPAELMAITFHNTDPKAPGNAARPVASTDAEGKFALSTNADKDGAVPGEYIVTFFWASENGPNAYDRLGGRFSTPAKSEFRYHIERKENDLDPIKLEVDPKSLKPARNPTGLRQ